MLVLCKRCLGVSSRSLTFPRWASSATAATQTNGAQEPSTQRQTKSKWARPANLGQRHNDTPGQKPATSSGSAFGSSSSSGRFTANVRRQPSERPTRFRDATDGASPRPRIQRANPSMTASRPAPAASAATSDFSRDDTRRKAKDKRKGTFTQAEPEPVFHQRVGNEASKQKPARRSQVKLVSQTRSKLYIPRSVTISNLSRLLSVRLETLQNKMQEAGFDDVSHDVVLTSDLASLLAEEFGYDSVVDEVNAFDLFPAPAPQPEAHAKLPTRPPVVTIMGHVDHGKTTLLDTLRKASVAAGEAGGITQHIGAFSVASQADPSRTITFLDTPGHAAFESMRKRGADVTDMVVLVVAADDSVMPQTREAIRHARSANVPVIVALNKVDKPGATAKQMDKVKRDLLAEGVELEEFGGEVQCVAVSGLTGKGLDDLEEAILGLAEVVDIRAEPKASPEGWVLESSVKKGRGNVASVVIKRGTLSRAGFVVAGTSWCKVRALTDESGKVLTRGAGPGAPVEVSGWSSLPEAGDELLGAKDEKQAKLVVANRQLRIEQARQLQDIQAINDKRHRDRELALASEQSSKNDPTLPLDEPAEPTGPILVPIIVRADVSGSAEAVKDSLSALGTERVAPLFVDVGPGDVTESDISRASSAGALVVGLGCGYDSRRTEQLASRDHVNTAFDTVIYRLIDRVRDHLASKLPPILTTRVTAQLNILKVFTITVKQSGQATAKAVAGCRVVTGAVERASRVRVFRKAFENDVAGEDSEKGELVYDGLLSSLKTGKEEVTKVNKGSECGLAFADNFDGFKEGDLVQCYVEETSAPKTL
ncbi:translation initiation factor IF-2 [Savitreella phatthalungensis]